MPKPILGPTGKPLILDSGKPAIADDPCTCCGIIPYESCVDCYDALTMGGWGLSISGGVSSSCASAPCGDREYFWADINGDYFLDYHGPGWSFSTWGICFTDGADQCNGTCSSRGILLQKVFGTFPAIGGEACSIFRTYLTRIGVDIGCPIPGFPYFVPTLFLSYSVFIDNSSGCTGPGSESRFADLISRSDVEWEEVCNEGYGPFEYESAQLGACSSPLPTLSFELMPIFP